jgi:hypothetical protein
MERGIKIEREPLILPILAPKILAAPILALGDRVDRRIIASLPCQFQ